MTSISETRSVGFQQLRAHIESVSERQAHRIDLYVARELVRKIERKRYLDLVLSVVDIDERLDIATHALMTAKTQPNIPSAVVEETPAEIVRPVPVEFAAPKKPCDSAYSFTTTIEVIRKRR